MHAHCDIVLCAFGTQAVWPTPPPSIWHASVLDGLATNTLTHWMSYKVGLQDIFRRDASNSLDQKHPVIKPSPLSHFHLSQNLVTRCLNFANLFNHILQLFWNLNLERSGFAQCRIYIHRESSTKWSSHFFSQYATTLYPSFNKQTKTNTQHL